MNSEFTITLCVCPKCGTDRTTMHKFCPKCGTRLIVNGLFIKVEDGEIKEVKLTK
ncbi:unnamed protein product [marine sediment metagenome]|uniref:Zinc-ribbon domain-containing protein n=1 Tax=marine sediment metagenome TaxID=412755 RepID=X1N2B5_9ZZZZ